ncbi:MAG TPA: TA system VapC family ribonuclease toxin [Candidatus Dormibacteraeota bacterium]|nr:TA system VapC family ribonuclease toxin [Candidatus Dormibacteraeota bacterium]
MTSTVDTNVLLYASDTASARHAEARRLIDSFARGPEVRYLFWPVLMGYLRLATHPSVFAHPLPFAEAAANLDDLLRRPHLRVPSEGRDFWSVARLTLIEVSAAGNLVSDAHLVALMRTHGVSTIWTADRDLRKFDGIRVRNPFAVSSGH